MHMAMSQVRATRQSSTIKFMLKQITWSHENEDNGQAYFQAFSECVWSGLLSAKEERR